MSHLIKFDKVLGIEGYVDDNISYTDLGYQDNILSKVNETKKKFGCETAKKRLNDIAGYCWEANSDNQRRIYIAYKKYDNEFLNKLIQGHEEVHAAQRLLPKELENFFLDNYSIRLKTETEYFDFIKNINIDDLSNEEKLSCPNNKLLNVELLPSIFEVGEIYNNKMLNNIKEEYLNNSTILKEAERLYHILRTY